MVKKSPIRVMMGGISMNKLYPIFLAVQILTFSTLVLASGTEKSDPIDHDHQAWTVFLKRHVKMGENASTVNYKAIKSGPSSLTEYLLSVEGVSQEDFDHFSENEKLAFLINAYNAFTVKLIVDHYPVKSIKDIGSFLSSPWKKKFFRLLGKERHLDNIEHDMIRKQFNEPRIHFAVNCASIGCPALQDEAFVASRRSATRKRIR